MTSRVHNAQRATESFDAPDVNARAYGISSQREYFERLLWDSAIEAELTSLRSSQSRIAPKLT